MANDILRAAAAANWRAARARTAATIAVVVAIIAALAAIVSIWPHLRLR